MEGRKTLGDRIRETTERLKSLSVSDPVEKRFNDLVSRATSEMWINPDWSLNMELVDAVNSKPGQQTNEKVFRCIRRRLHTRNSKVQVLTLTLLETLVKNCGATFQSDLARSDLWTDVAALAEPRRKVDLEVVDKVLLMVEDYARTLRPQRYQKTYTDLCTQGVRFPERDPDEVGAGLADLPPVNASPDSEMPGVSQEDQAAIQAALRDLEAADRQPEPQPRTNQDSVGLDLLQNSQNMTPADQSQKLLGDLSVVRNSVDVLEEALGSIPSNNPAEVEQEFIKELAEQCSQMRPRLASLIEATSLSEEVLLQALTLYEALDKALNRFDELLARAAGGGGQPQEQQAPDGLPVSSGGIDVYLLDESDTADANTALLANRRHAYSDRPAQTPQVDLLGDLEPAVSKDEFSELAAGNAPVLDGFDALARSSAAPAPPGSNPAQVQQTSGVDALAGLASTQVSSAPGQASDTRPAPPTTKPSDQMDDLITF